MVTGWNAAFLAWFLALVAVQVRTFLARRDAHRRGFGVSAGMLLPAFNVFSDDWIAPDFLIFARAHLATGERGDWCDVSTIVPRRWWHGIWNPQWPPNVHPQRLTAELSALAQVAKHGDRDMASPLDVTRHVVPLPAECYLSLPYRVLLESAARGTRAPNASAFEFAVIRVNGLVVREPTLIILSGLHAA